MFKRSFQELSEFLRIFGIFKNFSIITKVFINFWKFLGLFMSFYEFSCFQIKITEKFSGVFRPFRIEFSDSMLNNFDFDLR
jgi:hypothetical protein